MADINGNGTTSLPYHVVNGPNQHVIKIDLRFLILNDDGNWLAQGLEIDVSAEGRTKEEMRSNFELTLVATVADHIATHGNLDRLFTSAHKDYWDKYWKLKVRTGLTMFGTIVIPPTAEPKVIETTASRPVVVDTES